MAGTLTSGFQNGTWFLLQVGGKIIGGQRNAALNTSADKIYTTSKNSKDHRKTVIRGEFEETITLEGITNMTGGAQDVSTSNWSALYTLYKAGAEVSFDLVQCIDASATTPVTVTIGSGKGIITSCPLTMPENEASTWSIEMHVNDFTPATLA